MKHPSPFLSLVVPAYRQAHTICRELVSLDAYLRNIVPSHEIILVIDGNDDNSLKMVTQALRMPRLRIQCFENNQGKGAALHYGFSVAQGELVAFVDAGGDISVESLELMVAELKLCRADIVIGSKRHSLSRVTYPRVRRLYSVIYQLLVRFLFHLNVRDTQVGLKLFRREVLQTVLPRVLVKRFAFDLELLVVANRLGFTQIVEAPVIIEHNFSSTIHMNSVCKTLWDTLAIFYRLYILRWYDKEPGQYAPVRYLPEVTQKKSVLLARSHTRITSVAAR